MIGMVSFLSKSSRRIQLAILKNVPFRFGWSKALSEQILKALVDAIGGSNGDSPCLSLAC
jgi:hypothetical protein